MNTFSAATAKLLRYVLWLVSGEDSGFLEIRESATIECGRLLHQIYALLELREMCSED